MNQKLMERLLYNIYATNEDDPDFFHKLNRFLGTLEGRYTEIGGGFNQTPDPVLDRSKYSHAPSKGRVALGQLQEDTGLVDIWRLMNPSKRKYNIYSHNHKSVELIISLFLKTRLNN